jgi:hypothetical protein
LGSGVPTLGARATRPRLISPRGLASLRAGIDSAVGPSSRWLGFHFPRAILPLNTGAEPTARRLRRTRRRPRPTHRCPPALSNAKPRRTGSRFTPCLLPITNNSQPITRRAEPASASSRPPPHPRFLRPSPERLSTSAGSIGHCVGRATDTGFAAANIGANSRPPPHLRFLRPSPERLSTSAGSRPRNR